MKHFPLILSKISIPLHRSHESFEQAYQQQHLMEHRLKLVFWFGELSGRQYLQKLLFFQSQEVLELDIMARPEPFSQPTIGKSLTLAILEQSSLLEA